MDPLAIIRLQNPWLTGGRVSFPARFVPREAQETFRSWEDASRALVLTGPRQAGKSTLILRWIADGFADGRLRPDEILYLNADHIGLRGVMEAPETLLELTRALPGGRARLLVLDEAQRLAEPGLLVKQLVDLRSGMRIVVSGSSSLVLRSQAREHLTGRQIELVLPPLSLRELAAARPELAGLVGAPLDELRRRWPLVCQPLNELCDRLAVLGGYPDVVTAEDTRMAEGHLLGLYDTYVRRDVVDFLRVADPAPFNRLVGLLAEQLGGEMNKSELAASAGVATPTVDRFLGILADTHVMVPLPPFFTNRRKEIVKSRKAFFLDGGLRNAAVGQTGELRARADRGPLVENLVVSETWKQLPRLFDLRFWRTKAGAEVDLVLRRGDALAAVEVKAGSLHRPGVSRGFRSFCETYRPVRAFVLNRDRFFPSRPGEPEVVPVAAFLLHLPHLFAELDAATRPA